MKHTKAITTLLSLCLVIASTITICASEQYEDANGYLFYIENGEATYTGYKGSETNITVPAAANGCKVTSVDLMPVFDENGQAIPNKIESLEIPEGVTNVSGILGSPSLTHVKFPSTATNIDSHVFNNSVNLKSIEVSSENPKFTSRDGCLYGKDLKKLYFCASSDDNIVIIPSSVTSYNEMAFASCRNLESISCSGESTVFSSKDGTLYTANGKTLLCYGGTASTFTVPDGVTSLLPYPTVLPHWEIAPLQASIPLKV